MQSQLEGDLLPDSWYLAVEAEGAKVRAVTRTSLCRLSPFPCPVSYVPKSTGQGRVCVRNEK